MASVPLLLLEICNVSVPGADYDSQPYGAGVGVTTEMLECCPGRWHISSDTTPYDLVYSRSGLDCMLQS